MEILSFETTPFIENCYVVRDSGEALVIDPGEATPELLDAIEGYTVKTVVNTHCHCDHCGGNAEILLKTGAELICHENELGLLRALPQQGMMFGVPFDPSPDPNRFIKEGDTVSVGAITFAIREAPGHSPGHVILVGDGFVISGDVLFAGSIGRTDLPGGSYPQLIQSIRTKMLTLPDVTIVYSGHGPETTIGVERRTNPFLVDT
ncbi:MAG: MBL fold metallo-hydrolase [Candidatus Hydrogenedentes bacterium]|nr:MBL fold metallo-hydrolase [Candidatus Hydrogenedentota bacterium]